MFYFNVILLFLHADLSFATTLLNVARQTRVQNSACLETSEHMHMNHLSIGKKALQMILHWKKYVEDLNICKKTLMILRKKHVMI
ncbi:uncharacterized protein LOC112460385 isoform X2 [Temnothorax curvispinosus]|uniref:Uncharacterized protein LOC112460385 isoform X2 n=1 Tax=Temnothorax curvispinosus TaxID=300111 RepID=A0A6J1QEQ4_9HYME|nr:uncharacterized protein LOC112460385 isoform X2 [Temnothorax curvispinosus]